MVQMEAALEDAGTALYDVLVLGNWVHEVTQQQEESLNMPLQRLERLRRAELQTSCCIFPPLDHSITFARFCRALCPAPSNALLTAARAMETPAHAQGLLLRTL
jgi:hypothetical protein